MTNVERDAGLRVIVETCIAWLAAFVLVCLVVGTVYLFLGPTGVNNKAPSGRPCPLCGQPPAQTHDHSEHGGDPSY